MKRTTRLLLVKRTTSDLSSVLDRSRFTLLDAGWQSLWNRVVKSLLKSFEFVRILHLQKQAKILISKNTTVLINILSKISKL